MVIDPPGQARPLRSQPAQAQESAVVRRQLDNGLVVLVKRHAVAPLVSVQAFVRAGVLSDARSTSGRAALATRLMARGTEKYTGKQVAEYFDSIGGVLVTDSQRNASYLQCSVLKEDFPPALDYVRQVLFRPTFPEEEFEKVRQQQLDEIAARKADPRAEILDFWTGQLPETTPYCRTVAGNPATVSGLTVADCRDFHRFFFPPNNMVLAVYGDLDPAATLARLEETFAGEPAARTFAFPEFPAEHEAFAPGSVHLTSERENTSLIVLSYPSVRILDVPTQDAFEVLDAILTGGRGIGGRLFNELRGERLVYHISGHSLSGLAAGFYYFLAQTRPPMRHEVIRRIQAGVRQIGEQGVPDEEFALAQHKLITGHALRNTTPAAQAFQAAVLELYGLGYRHDDSYAERIRRVTVQDVQRIVQRFFQQPLVVTSARVGSHEPSAFRNRMPAHRQDSGDPSLSLSSIASLTFCTK